MALRFAPAETTRSYMETLRDYLDKYGRALALYSDRQVKELRLRNISDIESANLWLSEFMKDYNSRFASVPRENGNAHREILHSPEELNYILSYQSRRVLSKNLTFQYKTSAYQIRSEGQGYRLRHAIVTVCENFN